MMKCWRWIRIGSANCSKSFPLDDYADNRRTGSFLLIDEQDGATLTAAMAGSPLRI